jgi:serine phosphatase RsbU (regulator of sigma subunit)/anti-sigma regulatory factor (Ser/Thr protein kinase)
VMPVLAERIRDVFGADLARILLIEPDRDGELALGAAVGFGPVAAGTGVPVGDALRQVVAQGRPLILNEAGPGLDRMLTAARPRAVMAAPLTVKGRLAGAVEVGSRSSRRFNQEEESLLVLMADRAGLAIEHARAYEREVGTVELLQRSLLPDRLPTVPGLQIAARYLPGGADVGGDWYDAIPLESGALGVAMGDVVGHGIGAAALMGQLRHAARAYALEGHSPGAVLDRLDRLVRTLEGAQMATLLYLVVDPEGRTVRFASAGHVPPLAIGPDRDARFLEGAPDPPLGVFPSAEHTELSAEIEPGTTIVLYTDGLVEKRGVSIDDGLDALRRAACEPADPEELCEHLLDAMLAIHAADDDIAVLALRASAEALERLELEVSTDPTLLREVRRDVARWLRAAGASSEDVELIQMACHEACSNAIEHGYGFGEGTFTIAGVLDDGKVIVEVSDRGGWVERAERLPKRGRGLALIEAVMDEVELSHDGGGTTVRMARRLAADPVASAT